MSMSLDDYGVAITCAALTGLIARKGFEYKPDPISGAAVPDSKSLIVEALSVGEAAIKYALERNATRPIIQSSRISLPS